MFYKETGKRSRAVVDRTAWGGSRERYSRFTYPGFGQHLPHFLFGFLAWGEIFPSMARFGNGWTSPVP